MSSPSWVRLYHGRLWHILDTAADTRCGEAINPSLPHEQAAGLPPVNAQVCERCVRHIREEAALALLAWENDPRQKNRPLLPLATLPEQTILG